MRYTAYYVIRNRESLRKRIPKVPDLSEFLSEPVLWTKEQGGRDSWTSEDHMKAVKYLFLAYMKNALSDKITERIFGNFSISTEFFDSWWDLELFDGFDETVEDVAEELRHSEALKDLAHVKNPLVRQLIEEPSETTGK